MAESLLEENVAVLNLRGEELKRLVQNLVDFGRVKLKRLGANGP